MSNGTKPKVTVVIPTWKRGDLLRKCLESLRKQTFSDFEVVLVSNGGGEWVEELAREFVCRVIRFEENRGFAAGVNAGIAASRSVYVAILNDDVELGRAWLGRTTDLLDERQDVSFCCGKVYQVARQVARQAAGQAVRQAAGDTLDGAGDALSLGGSAWRLGYGRKDSPEFDVPRPLFAVSGTAALFRRSVLEQVGEFDEDFFSYLEDMDFSVRAMRAGHRGLYLPEAVCRHWGGATLGGPESATVFRLLTRNQLMLLAKHYPWSLLLRMAPRIAWAQLLWATMALRKMRLGAYLAGVVQFFLLLPRTLRKRRPWSKKEVGAFWTWLRESEEAIYADIWSRPRSGQDTFWRMYFLLFPPRANPATASRPGLGRLPSR